MGVRAAAVHLPLSRLDGKRAAEAGIRSGFDALRVPDWDEDPLTMAVEAGLGLPSEALEDVERVRLFGPDEAGLATRALGVDAPASRHAGATALLDELAAGPAGRELWLAAGATVGGCGVALRVEPGGDPPASSHVTSPPLTTDPARAAAEAARRLDPDGELPRRTPPGQAAHLDADPHGLAVGDAGPAAAALELAAAWARGETCIVTAGDEGAARAVRVEAGPEVVAGLDRDPVELDVEAYRRRRDADPPAWSEASQGAYVSREVYEADPERRYGARSRGPGRVAARTTIEAGPPGEFQRQHEASGPYDVVIVDLDREGGREIGQATTPPGRLSIGDRVRPVLRRVFSMEDETRYGLKWRPDEAH